MILARLEHLAALGGKVLVRGSGPEDQSVAEFVQGFMPFVRRAEELGVQIGIENHRGSVINSIASMRELLDRVESPALGIAFAPIHVHMAHEDIPEAIHGVGDRIALCYAWDWGPTADKFWKDPQEQVPGTGVIDFHAMFPRPERDWVQKSALHIRPRLGVRTHGRWHCGVAVRSSPLPAGGTRPWPAVTWLSLGRWAELPLHSALLQPHSQPLLSWTTRRSN